MTRTKPSLFFIGVKAFNAGQLETIRQFTKYLSVNSDTLLKVINKLNLCMAVSYIVQLIYLPLKIAKVSALEMIRYYDAMVTVVLLLDWV